MANIEVSYLYRDADNYKEFNNVVFANPDGLALDEVKRRLESATDSYKVNFIASQVRLRDLFIWDREDGGAKASDHCYHELEQVVATNRGQSDALGRTIREFVEEFEEAARAGWEAFNPA